MECEKKREIKDDSKVMASGKEIIGSRSQSRGLRTLLTTEPERLTVSSQSLSRNGPYCWKIIRKQIYLLDPPLYNKKHNKP